MKSIKTEFPNPVLAADRDDYIESCTFSTHFNAEEIKVTTDYIIIPISYNLVCTGLTQMISEGSVVAVISIKSSAASYSRLYKFPANETIMEISIPKFSVVKRIELAGSIIAAKEIKDFKCDGEFNELYFGNSTFDIRKGDVLAKEESRVIYVDDSELEKPLASIFNINNGHEQEDQVLPDFVGEKIEINLCESLYRQYMDFINFNNGALRRYVTAVIVYPVLVEAIARICESYQNGNGVDHDKRWFRAIELKAEKRGIKLDDYADSYTTLANQLLGDISLDSLQRLKDVLESDLNSGETQVIGGKD